VADIPIDHFDAWTQFLRAGIGSALTRQGLGELEAAGAAG
jgi:hypothetical protein